MSWALTAIDGAGIRLNARASRVTTHRACLGVALDHVAGLRVAGLRVARLYSRVGCRVRTWQRIRRGIHRAAVACLRIRFGPTLRHGLAALWALRGPVVGAEALIRIAPYERQDSCRNQETS